MLRFAPWWTVLGVVALLFGSAVPARGQARPDPLSFKGDYSLVPGWDYKSALLLRGDTLTVLTGNGLTSDKPLKLGKKYRRIGDREDHYVALSDDKALDVIDKKTLKVRKSIELQHEDFPAFNVEELAIHPTKPISYVSLMHATEVPRYRVMVVDEAGGEITAPEKMCGVYLAVDPEGRTLYVGYKDIGDEGDRLILPADRLVLKSYMGSFDVLISFALEGEKATPRLWQVLDRAGGNGQGMRLSPDGRRVTYLSAVGYPYFSGNLAGLDARDLKRKGVTYPLKGVGSTSSMDYHPTLNLVAMPGDKTAAVFFDRETGKAQADRLKAMPGGLGKVEHVFFAPDGQHLLLACAGADGARTLRSVGLKLSPDELETVKKGYRRPGK
jgi:hypothetical protein